MARILAVDNGHLTALIDLGLRLASERDAPRLLDDFCRYARDLVGARYAVIGIVSENVQSSPQIVTSGMTSAETAAIRTLAPRTGVLSTLLDGCGSMRLRCEGAEPYVQGLPPEHPPVRSFLGLAIATPSKVYGWVSFTDKLGSDKFSDEDERLATTLAAQVAIAYENAQLCSQLAGRAAKLEQEVSERVRLEAELRERVNDLAQVNRRKDDFLAMLAHELRNPLAPILNALEVIRLGGTDSESIAHANEVAVRQVRHMARLIDDLLDIARIKRGSIQLRKEQVDLTTVVTHAVEMTRSLMEASGHELTLHLPSGPVRLEGDSVRLEQVFANLLNNAAKYTQTGGRITLSAKREGAEVVVRVRDNGIGISAEMLTKVFDLFTQADHTLDRSKGGLGIGLTLVRSLVAMHGGSVSVHSEGLGKGCEFAVRLSAVASAAASEPNIAPEAPNVPPLHVLVIDDHVDSARTLGKVLKLWGHHSRVAHSGHAAIEEVAAATTDLVLLDIGLPGMDGYEVARELRKRPNGDDLVIVALTGYGQEEDRRRSRAAGINHHLVKPVDLNDLRELLAHTDRIN
jgi:signal transduction histidine kinase